MIGPNPFSSITDFRNSGVNMSAEQLYPGDASFRNPISLNSTAPNIRSALFTGLTEQRYDALITALLQLRTPKLSQRLDPALLSTLLSRALPPLATRDPDRDRQFAMLGAAKGVGGEIAPPSPTQRARVALFPTNGRGDTGGQAPSTTHRRTGMEQNPLSAYRHLIRIPAARRYASKPESSVRVSSLGLTGLTGRSSIPE